MNIYDVLKKDHRELENLLDQLVSASEKNATTDAILDQIQDELIPHSRAEEAVFYNTLKEFDNLKDLANHGFREHMQAEGMLRTLQGLEKMNIEWTAAAQKLRDSLLHHIAEEEGPIFIQAKKVLSEQEAVQMVRAFESLKQKAKQQGGLKNTADMIKNMMPKGVRDALTSDASRHAEV